VPIFQFFIAELLLLSPPVCSFQALSGDLLCGTSPISVLDVTLSPALGMAAARTPATRRRRRIWS
jgi:hypothetical protein